MEQQEWGLSKSMRLVQLRTLLTDFHSTIWGEGKIENI